jgi:hypothetical protein
MDSVQRRQAVSLSRDQGVRQGIDGIIEQIRASGPESSKHQLSESEQTALFHEFLRWKERQSAANSRAVGASPQTINP